ncbi:MAG: hypothetical protein EBX30_13465, partial [Betaproteobacteria bacterium]|nr:hypothetical protein [Betaproteobacteria bacterium]
CKMKFMTKEAASYGSDNGKGANWHPTRAFHMMRGEMIAWLWGLAMLDAVYTVEGALGTGSAPEALLKQMQTKLDALQPALPAPKKCQNLHCEAKPTCYTDFKPHYSPNLRLKDIVVGRTNWIRFRKAGPARDHRGFGIAFAALLRNDGGFSALRSPNRHGRLDDVFRAKTEGIIRRRVEVRIH